MKEFLQKYQFWLQCWGISFGIALVVFSFYIMTFFIGNHDFPFIRYGIPLNTGVWEGRITQFVIPWLLFERHILPILGIIVGFMTYSLAVILLIRWYEVPQKKILVILLSLPVLINPYIFSQLYYAHTAASVLCWPVFCVLGGIFAFDFVKKYKIKLFFIALFCWLFALLGYASVLELILSVSVGKFFIDIFSDKKLDKVFFKQWLGYGIVLLLTILIYASVIKILKLASYINEGMYNVQSLSLLEIGKKILSFWDEPFRGLMQSVPYCSIYLNYFVVLLMLFVLYVALQKKKLLWGGIFLVSLVYATFFLAYCSPYNFFRTVRVHALSVSYLITILLIVLFKFGKKWQKNIAFVIAFFVVLIYLRVDFIIQKMWFLGTEQDERVSDRIRAEIMPQMIANKHYRLSSIGNLYGRRKFSGYNKVFDEEEHHKPEYYKYGMYLSGSFSSGLFLYEDINPIWGDIVYIGESVMFADSRAGNIGEGKAIDALLFNKHYGEDKNQLIAAVDRLCAYPCKDFYYIGEKDILLMVGDDENSQLILRNSMENSGNF